LETGAVTFEARLEHSFKHLTLKKEYSGAKCFAIKTHLSLMLQNANYWHASRYADRGVALKTEYGCTSSPLLGFHSLF
jgi:hypothetical protein